MTAELVVLADEDIAALVCAGSGFPAVGADSEPPAGIPSVSFSADRPGDVSWLREPPASGRAARTVATSGDGLWRRAPWPAADDLFDWQTTGERIVVVAGDDAGPAVERLREQGADVEPVVALGPRDLEAAAVVVMPGVADDPLPADAPAVLAAGRILVTTPRTPDFGLRPGIDHCLGSAAGDLADLALSAARHPHAFQSMRVYGRLAAERHRASRVLADLATDLRLEL